MASKHQLVTLRLFKRVGLYNIFVSLVTISSKLGALNIENCLEFGVLN